MNGLFSTRLLTAVVLFTQLACASSALLASRENRHTELPANTAVPGNQPVPIKVNRPAATPKPVPKKPANAVCGNPAQPCRHQQKDFDDWELSFQMPAHLVANKEYSSAPFYAVIVKQYEAAEECDEFDSNPTVEPERLKLQKRFPANKVFADYSCPNMAAVTYDFPGRLDPAGEKVLYMDYIAVYAGDSMAEARRLRDELQAEFPQAEIKRMTASFGIIDQ